LDHPGYPDKRVRISLITVAAFLVALTLSNCGPAPVAPRPDSQRDETQEPWYSQIVEQLAARNREANGLFKSGRADAAAAIVQTSEPLAGRLLSVRRPTLAAMEDASDLDDLYGRMLLSNRNYGWARLFFQKNLARWKNWTPRTPDTAGRLKEAQSAIAECDRRLSEP
jgi:hypothetical protein